MNFSSLSKMTLVSLMISGVIACHTPPISDTRNSANPAIASSKSNHSSAVSNIPEPQNIKFVSADKVVIAGTFYESPKEKSPAVLLLHQWASDRKSYDGFAKQIQSKGFGALAIDGRGFGESVRTSEGKPVASSRTDDSVKGMNSDVANAFDFLSKQKNVDPSRIGIIGASYGSSLAIIFAAGNTRVKAVALLSPGLNYFGNLAIEPALKTYGDRSLLLVAAEDDSDSSDSVRKLKAESRFAKLETKIYPSGGHGTRLFESKVGLEDLLEEFFARTL